MHADTKQFVKYQKNFLRFDIKSCWSWPTKFYIFIEKKAFKICPLVNLVEKIWINFKIWFGTLLPLSACSWNSKGLSDVDFLQCLEHQQNKKVEKMLQLLSTHNSECETLSYFWSIKYPEKGPFTCGDQSAPMGIPAEVKGTIKLNYTYSVTWEVRGQP